MISVEHIERAVSRLSREELSEFRAWFLAFDAMIWDQQLEKDVALGRLDQHAEDALAEHRAGRSRPL